MAFTVTYDGMDYKLSIGDGRPAKTRSIDEVCEALRHHYLDAAHGTIPQPSCPFCRQLVAHKAT